MYEGIGQISPIYVRVARTLGAPDSEIFLKGHRTAHHSAHADRVARGLRRRLGDPGRLRADCRAAGAGRADPKCGVVFQLDIIYVGIICIGFIALAMDFALRTFCAPVGGLAGTYFMSVNARDRISFESVSVDFQTASGPLRVVDDVSYCIREGEFVSVIGPSGCGKTTMMNIVAGS